MNNFSPDLLERITNDSAVRREVTKESHKYFIPIYLHEYIKYPSASFHTEMIEFTERTDEKFFAIVSFRGSAKSTIFSLSYPIWAILGKQQKKFVLLISRTQVQAKQLLHNIKIELERNELLKQDLGPFEEPQDEWRASSIVIPKYDARITVLSADQSMRGLRHKSHRPDLIICDDIEDIASTKTQDNRDKTFNWFTSEIIPAGDLGTKIILIGNLVHEDSLIMRLREKIEHKEVDGVFKAYPLVNSHGNCLWPEKFPTPESLETLKREVMSNKAWEREYLLRLIPDDGQIIDPLWIRHYHDIPKDMHQLGIYVGVDLAISKGMQADYTAMVPVLACEKNQKLYLYILPEIVHKRMNFPETCQEIRLLEFRLKSKYQLDVTFIIESVAYQEAIVQQLKENGIEVTGVKPLGDKRERLSLTATPLSEGQIWFPFGNSSKLEQEMIHFGVEKHDDLADAFSIVTLDVLVNRKPRKRGILFG
ncbi:MAG: Terminase-like family protein [Parcubacteria bacterium OLB19]|nr:MAG: Terminase-like family protein [Parcubacteria bacterium OLB19]